MKKIAVWKQASLWIVLSVLWVCACGFPEEENWDYTHISLFCDVDFWTPPKWDTAENTITGKITKELLEDDRLSVEQIAEMVGYRDYFYFTKVFKKTEGVSPSSYRKNRRAIRS